MVVKTESHFGESFTDGKTITIYTDETKTVKVVQKVMIFDEWFTSYINENEVQKLIGDKKI